MAQAMMLFSASPVIAPIFGGFLHDYFGWRSIFWFLVIYGTAVMDISVIRMVLPLALYTFSLSIIMPIISVEILNCFPNNRGAASAMQSFIQMGFNGFSISVIVAALGSLLFNFTLAQLILMTIAMALWFIDLRSFKAHPPTS